jgi:hypothetical protein
MGRDLRRALGIRDRRRPRFGAVLASGLVAAAALAVLAFAVGLQPDPPPAAPVGLTDRDAYGAVSSGLPKSEVRRLLGGPPHRVQTSPLQVDGPECWLYGRRSGREGGYRFCFRGDLLDSKTRT